MDLDEQLRMNCIDFAIRNHWDGDPGQIVRAAQAFYDFVKNEKPEAKVSKKRKR